MLQLPLHILVALDLFSSIMFIVLAVKQGYLTAPTVVLGYTTVAIMKMLEFAVNVHVCLIYYKLIDMLLRQ